LANPFIPANGHPIFPVGQVSLNVNVQGITIPSTLYVVNNLHPKLILGNDWLKSTRAVMDYRTGVLSLFDDLILCPLEGFNSLQNYETLRQTICMQPYTEGIFPIQVPQKYRDMSVLIEPLINECALPVKVAGTICSTRGLCGVLRVLNATAETVTIRRFTKLGTITTLNTISSIQPFVRPKQPIEDDNIENPKPEILGGIC